MISFLDTLHTKIVYPPWRKNFHGNGDTIRIGRKIQCLPYALFFIYKARGGSPINDRPSTLF